MDEPDLSVRQLDNVRCDGRSQRLRGDSGCLDQLHRGCADDGDDEQRRPRLLGKGANPIADEALERLRHGEGLSGIERCARRRKRPGKLQGVERVAARHLVQSQHRGARERPAEPVANDALDRAQAERADEQSLDASAKRLLERGRLPAAPTSEERPDGLTIEPPQSERQRIGRRRVEPLDVIDRDHDRTTFGQRREGAVHSHRKRTGVCCRSVAVPVEQKRSLERPPPRSRELRQHLGGAGPEQVAERSVRESLLGLRGSSAEHAQRPFPCRLDPGQPERRLADAGVALEHDRGRSLAKKACRVAISSSLPTISTATVRPC